MSRFVRIYYGPYESFYTVSHKPQKLRGLQDRLLREGFRAELIPVEYRNCCVIKMQGVEIFRCNLKNLLFNTPSTLDRVATRAVAAVLDASRRFQSASDYLWLKSVLLDDVLSEVEARHVPKNYWPQNVGCVCFNDLDILGESFIIEK